MLGRFEALKTRGSEVRIIDALNPKFVFRDAGTGKFISRTYAALNPKTTTREHLDDQAERLEYLEGLTIALRDAATAKGYDTITAAVEAAPTLGDDLKSQTPLTGGL